MNPVRHDPYAALRHPNYRRFALGAALSSFGGAMQSVAVGWDLYERTGSAWALGAVGLVQVLPVFALALPAGHLADRVDRRRILLVAQAVMLTSSVVLALLALAKGAVPLVYACLFASGVARAFAMPAGASFWPTLLPPKDYGNAMTWRSGGFELAGVLGPALGGMFIAWATSAFPCYLACAGLTFVYGVCVFRVETRAAPKPAEPLTRDSLLAGFRFVWGTKVILGAITLDMFAVLLGGATALLPIYAKDILQVGPAGLGWLRAAPGFGALAMALFTVYRAPVRRAGSRLLWAVAGFGVATIVFGLSTSFWLSMLALGLTGVFDNISVVIRHSLVQLRTPDAMRGRVTAVNSVFISCSNELGAFESGAVAALFTPVISVVAGGIGTLAVVAAAVWRWPELRRLGPLQPPVVETREGDAAGDL